MLECRARWHGAESIPVKSEISVVLEWDPDIRRIGDRRRARRGAPNGEFDPGSG